MALLVLLATRTGYAVEPPKTNMVEVGAPAPPTPSLILTPTARVRHERMRHRMKLASWVLIPGGAALAAVGVPLLAIGGFEGGCLAQPCMASDYGRDKRVTGGLFLGFGLSATLAGAVVGVIGNDAASP